jgi:hypothetical protein
MLDVSTGASVLCWEGPTMRNHSISRLNCRMLWPCLGPCRNPSRMRSIGQPPHCGVQSNIAAPENLSNGGPHTVPQPRHWSCVAFQLFNGFEDRAFRPVLSSGPGPDLELELSRIQPRSIWKAKTEQQIVTRELWHSFFTTSLLGRLMIAATKHRFEILRVELGRAPPPGAGERARSG